MCRYLVQVASKIAQFRPYSDSWLLCDSVGEKKIAKTGTDYDIKPKVDQTFSNCVTSQ